MKPFRFFLITVLSGFALYTASAQSGHYWTHQYGTRSMLLGGSVIGGVEDLGAVYYNPARLGLVENPAFLLSADVYQWQTMNYENGVGDGRNLKKSSFDGVPSLAAGTFKIKFLPNHQFAYAILSRSRSDLSFGYREEVTGDIIANWEGNEIFEGDVNLGNEVRDTWWGFAWAHALNSRFSIGASGFLSNVRHDRTGKLNLRALSQNSGNVAVFDYNRSFGFETYSMIWKLAAAYSSGNWQFGLTLTTPAINLKNNSNYSYQLYYSGFEGLTGTNDIYANSYQSDLSLTYKTPLTAGAGVSLQTGKSKLHFSAEYYGKINEYTLMEADPHYVQSKPDSLIHFKLTDQNQAIVNAGLGFEWYVSDNLSAYLSANTDFSTVGPNPISHIRNQSKVSNSTFQADAFHAAAGIVLTFKGADITLGVSRTGATQSLPRVISFPSQTKSTSEIFDPTETADFKWRRYIFVFSFSVPFLKDYVRETLEGRDEPD